MKRAQSSLASELNIRAADALDRAGKMPPGPEHAEAMQKATILENAAEMLEHFSGKVGVPAKMTVESYSRPAPPFTHPAWIFRKRAPGHGS
jgi:hypothetical protein